MRVAILGSGGFGAALAAAAVRAGHRVTVSARHPEHAEGAARAAGAEAAPSNRSAIEGAEVVVLALPFTAVADVAREAGSACAGRVVVDATNRFAPEAMDGTSNAEQVQDFLPGARVVKALNSIFAGRLGTPSEGGVPLDGFLAGDDAAAKEQVAEFLRTLGFRPVDAGPLVMARALEAVGLLGIQLQLRNGWSWQTGWKLVGPTGA